jgi:parallel beta-helix repeat protein
MRNVRVQNIQINNFFYGICIAFSAENNITGCNITNNRYGVALAESTGNTFYHNNFIGNTQQVIADGGANIWDDRYPSGGNYWDDYTGADLYSGPYQNETGSDGIGDSYFPISFPNVDNYPLMEPYRGRRDISMICCATSKSGGLPVPTVGQGNTIDVNITALNQGDSVETFNITAYADAITIETFENVTLNGGNSMTLSFVWNTTGFSKGNCTLLFSAEPVQNETDTLDNTLLSWIIITISGDVNGDGTVNITDSIYVANSFLAKLDDADWTSNADVNCDNIVNILDSITIGLNFLQHYP